MITILQTQTGYFAWCVDIRGKEYRGTAISWNKAWHLAKLTLDQYS